MSGTIRIDPRRPASTGPNGIRRIALSKRANSPERPDEKRLRTEHLPKRWLMAVSHSERGCLDDHACQAIAAAAILADADTGVIAVVLGELSEDLREPGADLVAVLPCFDVAHFQPGRELDSITSLIEMYAPQHIFIPDKSASDGDLGRRLIAKLGVNAASHVFELDATHVAIPWSAGSTRASTPLPRVILLTAGAVDAELPFVGKGDRVPMSELPAPSATKDRCRDLGLEETTASAIALEEADFIVSAGNGVRNVSTLESLAQTLGAAVGASRVAVDDGKFSRDKQVGATGKTVSASAYIAVGISGAVQHLQGIKDCRHVIAINTDAGAPIAKRADLTIIGDAEEVMQALITRIAQARAQRENPETT